MPGPGLRCRDHDRSGDRRHHFRHNASAPHPSDGESENHLAGKAMLAQWASERLPVGAFVDQEKSVKDPETALHRIADVMVTDATGHKVAFEVEYKPGLLTSGGSSKPTTTASKCRAPGSSDTRR